MSHQVSVWRAAQLVGVARGVLQQQVREGVLELNDSMVSTEALLRLYPKAQLEESGMLERVVQIRDEAFGKRVRERMLPSQEVLSQRLFSQSQDLGNVRRHLQRYHELVVSLQKAIRQQVIGHPHDTAWTALEQQATQGLAKVLATDSVDILEVMDDMLNVMTAQVTVHPSGHQFAVEGHSSLLQSGLHAGLRLNYGCGNGSCGMCKVRVISDEVAKTQHYDYPLSETEKAQGYTLMCCHTAASSDLTLEMLEAMGPQDIPQQEIVAKVRALTELAPNTRLLQLQTPRTHRLRFLAGQSVSLGYASPDQGDAQASYPVASCPCDDRNLLFFVARDGTDSLAQQVFSGNLRCGAAVTVRGPSGSFVLSEGHRPLVFAACDLGFAPIKSLIEHALALDAVPSISLFWLAMRADGHFQTNLCRAWSEALDNFEYELVTDPDVVIGAKQIVQAMRADLFDIDCDFYLCGPAMFVNTLHDDLRTAGVPAAQILMQEQ
ncbi:MAG: 2Fe-2S iron-sulfur cluster binding domain-containing protein [Comamonadaceae bacterium]|nr:2Fe-2S iron-sulfur cluster binding domain-containing protein [Comamonadaceae bacterium]